VVLRPPPPFFLVVSIVPPLRVFFGASLFCFFPPSVGISFSYFPRCFSPRCVEKVLCMGFFSLGWFFSFFFRGPTGHRCPNSHSRITLRVLSVLRLGAVLGDCFSFVVRPYGMPPFFRPLFFSIEVLFFLGFHQRRFPFFAYCGLKTFCFFFVLLLWGHPIADFAGRARFSLVVDRNATQLTFFASSPSSFFSRHFRPPWSRYGQLHPQLAPTFSSIPPCPLTSHTPCPLLVITGGLVTEGIASFFLPLTFFCSAFYFVSLLSVPARRFFVISPFNLGPRGSPLSPSQFPRLISGWSWTGFFFLVPTSCPFSANGVR